MIEIEKQYSLALRYVFAHSVTGTMTQTFLVFRDSFGSYIARNRSGG